jgi:hypothetical protein
MTPQQARALVAEILADVDCEAEDELMAAALQAAAAAAGALGSALEELAWRTGAALKRT